MKTGNFVRLFSILALLLFSSSRLASAPTTDPTYQQVPLTWGTGYLANETILAGQASHLEFSYLGTAASFGYWLATTPTPDVPEYSVSIANNGDLTLRAGENIIGVLPAAVQVGDIIALVGMCSVAVGFAFQDIAANFVSGVILAFRTPFQIGDIVEVNDIMV